MNLTLTLRENPLYPQCHLTDVIAVKSDGKYLRCLRVLHDMDGIPVVLDLPMLLADVAEIQLHEPT